MQQQFASEVVLTSFALFGQISSFQDGLTTKQHDALHKAKAILFAEIVCCHGRLFNSLRISRLRNIFEDIAESTNSNGWQIVCRKFIRIAADLDRITDCGDDDERSQALRVLRPIKNRDWVCDEIKRLTNADRAQKWMYQHSFVYNLVDSYL